MPVAASHATSGTELVLVVTTSALAGSTTVTSTVHTHREHPRHLRGARSRENRCELPMIPRHVQAQAFVESLPAGRCHITSRKTQGGKNLPQENRNWYLAIGEYVFWGSGDVEVGDANGRRTYVMDFVYHFHDRYNWDGGKAVHLFGLTVTDQFMGEFHRQGLGREFSCWGNITRRFQWSQGESITDLSSSRPPIPAKDTRVS